MIIRRHDFLRIRRGDASDELAGVDDLPTLLRHIEPQFSFARCRIEAVALEALVRQDRPHLAIVFDLRRRQHRRGEEQKRERSND